MTLFKKMACAPADSNKQSISGTSISTPTTVARAAPDDEDIYG
jgi:hypothetical protein